MSCDYLVLGRLIFKQRFEKEPEPAEEESVEKYPINFSRYFPLAEAVADMAN
jgi:hypothetical protein